MKIETTMKKVSTHDSLLDIQNSKKIKDKNRSRHASNRSKTTIDQNRFEQRFRAMKQSTQRNFSIFEYAQFIDFTIDESEIQMLSNQSLFSQYTIMSFFSNQFYSMSTTQYSSEFTNSTMISTTFSTVDRKRANNNNTMNNIKRAKKTN